MSNLPGHSLPENEENLEDFIDFDAFDDYIDDDYDYRDEDDDYRPDDGIRCITCMDDDNACTCMEEN